MNKELDFLTLEVGSTLTRANGFIKTGNTLKHVVQSFVPTTSALNNVGIGLFAAIDNLEKQGFGTDKAEVFADSSAYGAMTVTIHGVNQHCVDEILPYICSSGAIVRKATFGSINEYDLEELEEISPDVIILVGSKEFAYRDLLSENAIKISSGELHRPVICYGNAATQVGLDRIFTKAGLQFISIGIEPSENNLKVEKLQEELIKIFNKTVIKADGIERLKAISNHDVFSINYALEVATNLFSQAISTDVTVIDIGSSLTYMLSSNKPISIYGDLGVFLSAPPLIASLGDKEIASKLENVIAVPESEEQVEITSILRIKSIEIAFKRYKDTFKKHNSIIIGTGGSITRIANGERAISSVCSDNSTVLIDNEYIFSALGCIGTSYPELIKATLKKWVENHDKYSKIRDLYFKNC